MTPCTGCGRTTAPDLMTTAWDGSRWHLGCLSHPMRVLRHGWGYEVRSHRHTAQGSVGR